MLLAPRILPALCGVQPWKDQEGLVLLVQRWGWAGHVDSAYPSSSRSGSPLCRTVNGGEGSPGPQRAPPAGSERRGGRDWEGALTLVSVLDEAGMARLPSKLQQPPTPPATRLFYLLLVWAE